MDYREIDARDRRLVIVASPGRAMALSKQVDWKAVLKGDLIFAPTPRNAVLLYFLGPYYIPALMVRNALKAKEQALPYPIFDLIAARDQFKFPYGHPADGLVYTCNEAEPYLYVPLASFHRYMYEAKLAAFHELCANLGVRRCTVAYAEENNKDITGQFRASGIPTQMGPVSGGVSTQVNQNRRETAAVFLEYSDPPNRPLAETQSGWMNGEPSWVMMQKLRLEQNLGRYRAEFSYSSDMGVSAAAVAKIAGIGLDIGGKFEDMRQRKWIFDVEFWPPKAKKKKS